MNKLMMVACAAMAGAMVTGCATTDGNPVAEWQRDRFMHEQIDAAKKNNASGKVELKDVSYVSCQDEKFRVIGAPFSALGPVVGALYMPVVNGVDQKSIMESGREKAIEMNKLMKREENPLTKEQVFEEWAKNDKPDAKPSREVYEEYMKYVANVDNDETIKLVNDIISRQIPEASQKVADELTKALQALQNNPPTDASGMEILSALGKAKDDAAALGSELADTGVGAKLWLEILMDEKAMKEQMKSTANIESK